MAKKQKKTKQQKVAIADFPLTQLYFYLTRGCNLACRHCWLTPEFDPDGDKQPVLPIELFKQAVEEAIPMGLAGVKLTGGEPLLHPEFLAMLDFIKQKKLGLTLETNGLLCTPEIAQEIARVEDIFLSISIDGANAETHDKIRGVKGAFQKSTDAIRNLVKKNIRPQIIMSVMHANADQFEAIIKLAEELGASSIKFNVIQPTGRGEKVINSSGSLKVKDIISLGRRVENEFSNKTDLNLYFDYPAAFRSLSKFISGDACSVCSVLSILGILPTGEYALCGIGNHIQDLVFGRIGKDKLEDIWMSNLVLNDLRSGLPDNMTGICKNCLMKNVCLGSCIAQNYYRTNSLWAPFWFCEQAHAIGIFPESRMNIL